jgi:hypothetical protein
MIDFPGPPLTVGQIFTAAGCSWRWSGTKWVANVGSTSGGGGSTTTIGDFPPSTPTVGSGWFDSTDCNLYLWYSDPSGPSQWIPATNIPGPVGPAGPTGPAGVDGFGRSYIHNGLFNVAQRGNGPFTANAVYTLDRWQEIVLAPDTLSVSRVTLADADRTAIGDEAASYCLQNVFVGNSSGYQFIDHKIEGVRRLAGKTITISFWAKAAAGVPKLGVNLEQNFGSGGSPSAGLWTQAPGASVTLSTSWARYTVTISVPSVIGKTLGTNGDDYSGLGIFYSSGASFANNAGNIGVQSGTIQLWGVQLEIGTAATALEKPDPRYDLANCQRFYFTARIYYMTYTTTGGVVATTLSLPVTMRTTPTVGILSGGFNGNGNVTSFTLGAVGGAVVYAQASCVATGQTQINIDFTASADL